MSMCKGQEGLPEKVRSSLEKALPAGQTAGMKGNSRERRLSLPGPLHRPSVHNEQMTRGSHGLCPQGSHTVIPLLCRGVGTPLRDPELSPSEAGFAEGVTPHIFGQRDRGPQGSSGEPRKAPLASLRGRVYPHAWRAFPRPVPWPPVAPGQPWRQGRRPGSLRGCVPDRRLFHFYW